MLPEIIYKGSVKDVRGKVGVSPYIFEYSDRYSIYDWGRMPDLLEHKGESLAFLAWFFFDYLGKKGVRHHLLGRPEGRCLSVQPVDVFKPKDETKNGKLVWDYARYQSRPVNALVPLEVIFRFGVPEGSSLLKRTADPSYCKEIGRAAAPQTGDMFAHPVIECSTKLENKDRYISRAQAAEIAGLNAAELANLLKLAADAATHLKDCFDGIGVTLWDGKFEFAFTEEKDGARGFMLVDSIGPDELRLTLDGMHLSKEMLRAQYKNTPWLAALEKAKALADERGEKDWKKICTEELGQSPA
ncbi:MAG: phosphoribosylaminoimidazole succinocarboxamide synthase, partial [Alphaproteobacteria bacterium]|nr:phosphoribosylaminoimidazole succinocarboxamide synthase [Alphaproteobacteria bacterium]